MKSSSFFHFANRSSFATASWKSVVAWESCLFVGECVLNANLWPIEKRDAWWWQWCLLHLLSFASSSDVFSFWSFCKTFPFFDFSVGLYLVTEDPDGTSRLSDIARECLCTAFFTALVSCSRAL